MYPELPQSITSWLTARQSSPSHRQLLIIAGDEDWCIEKAESILAFCEWQTILWSGNRVTGQAIAHSDYRYYLGREFEAVVFNAHSGARANAMMSLSGTVMAGNLMILLCPPLNVWADQPDPELRHRTSYGFENQISNNRFIRWITEKIIQTDTVAKLTPSDFIGRGSFIGHTEKQAKGALTGQKIAIDAIVKDQVRPIVLTADRGRGKSSALGIASATLVQNQAIKIAVTGPNRAAVDQVFEHAARQLNVKLVNKNQIELANASIDYMAIDALLTSLPPAELLLIDEAAAIPNDQLKQLLQHYKRVVFSSTVHGYEGSGRGFEIRFKDYLEQHYPAWLSIHLDKPMRWSQGDVLERFWFDLMLMKPTAPQSLIPTKKNVNVCLPALQIKQVSQQELVQSPGLLSQVFNLMVDAHYQTVPDDLVRLLDAPDIRIFVVLAGNNLVGVMQLNLEGGKVLTDIAEEVCQGQRRPPGHLVAQQLAYSMGLAELAVNTYLRVVRIATSSAYQRQGIASQLLSAAKVFARSEKIDFFATSFGLNSSLLSFWQANRFLPVKLGTRRDASSGEYSLIMLQPIHDGAKTNLELLLSEFNKDIHYQMDKKGLKLDKVLSEKLTMEVSKLTSNSQQKTALLTQFAKGYRPLDSCERMVHEFLCDLPPETRKDYPLEYEFLDSRVSQALSNQLLCERYALTGKKAITAFARTCVKTLLLA